MTTSSQRAVGLPSLSLLAVGLLTAVHAHAQTAGTDTPDAQATELDRILVVGQRASRVSNGATNLDLDIKETPQSISVITKEQMDQFGADSLDDALRLATGIQVEQTSTNQTQYLARGFEIKNTQIDGVGLPNGWGVVTNAMDSFGFEKLEVIRGANGLLTGVGNSSGTINYVRKRPTNDAQGQVGLTLGSHGRRRVEADYSTPFTEDGTWAGRVVAVREESDSYLRDFESDRSYLYGVVDGQVGENGTLALGYSWQKADTSGNMWGALSFIDTGGNQLEWDRSASTTQDWTYWNSTTHAGFVDYTHRLGDSWQVKASYNYRVYDHDAKLFMAYSFGLDPATGEGLYGWAYKSPYETRAHLGDITVHGRFELFGQEQEAMFGVSSARSEGTDWYNPTDTSGPQFGALPGFPYAGDAIPEPVWGDRAVYTTLNQRLTRVFGATRLAFTDRFKTILGFNWAQFQRDSTDNAGGTSDITDRNLAPYAGVTFDFTDRITGYANYSYIYQPQDEVDYDRRYFDPSKGTNYEIGVKAEWLDQRLLTTLAWFSARQDGLATYVGTRFMDGYAYGYSRPVDIDSRGFEFEATGRLGEHTNLLFGYTQLSMDGEDGSDTYSWVPRRTANLLLSTRLSGHPALSFGFGGRWQGRISNVESYIPDVPVRQGGYTLFNAFAAWDIRPDVTLRANVNNITDKKYIQSLYSVSYYGAPREYALSLDWRF
ncbi:TonB-dependent siderophore receptor [Luteimonas sp. BDR2-5]|uniref:TonB-dependent siderophore receptor n=1 Tax=Proluteimonas luteida TaxID=2878685 RepID=UPI001E473639|nr:TonB-dependent siderophore receptor [Luteimonas sp. BDR2-5]MCD9028215.1 TonB-dependent siderophore receptor [Luteimonas sp. BDR2-5]